MIYSVLSDELSQGLHALTIKTKTPEEVQSPRAWRVDKIAIIPSRDSWEPSAVIMSSAHVHIADEKDSHVNEHIHN